MSRVIRFDQFLPVEKNKFLSALEGARLQPAQFDVSKMEIAPPLMPGNVTALVTVKLASSAIAFSYEDAAGSAARSTATTRPNPSCCPSVRRSAARRQAGWCSSRSSSGLRASERSLICTPSTA
jgi:hypothetical protein